ncbi:NYN domain-containing protein [Methylococcus sp. EFPC2]|uniref:NYN domain-containing protein n=1 Tax=Methylococcus sp. EFPC2 TaxID=2812648 RepID=UPI0019686892|nr:NYN domain-containing protein [Methylococcus sp. EFPC2]QSA95973.1 NYN domain-containing protein [Methylococcus sp. EFPC2]
MSQADAKIALLIDADNSPATKIDIILAELAKYGVANIRQAYGNWKNPNLKPWENVLHEYAIRPIQQFAYTKGKNATDIALVIDAMDLLYSQRLDAFCIVSSDSDFTPLIMRILTNGLKVYGFGEKKTPLPFVKACSRFVYLEALTDIDGEQDVKPSIMLGTESARLSCPPPETHFLEKSPSVVPPSGKPSSRINLPSDKGLKNGKIEGALPVVSSLNKVATNLSVDKQLIHLLKTAVAATVTDDGWSPLSAVGTHISNRTSFDSRNYGFKKLSDLFLAYGSFDVRKTSKGIAVRPVASRNNKGRMAGFDAVNSIASSMDMITSGNTKEIKSLVDKYIELLRESQWTMVSKFALLNFYRVMKGKAFYGKDELINHSLHARPSSTGDVANNVFDIFWKAKLFEVSKDLDGRKKIMLLDFPDVFDRIDRALLSKLVVACKERSVVLEPVSLLRILYGEYNQSCLVSMIESLREPDSSGV